MKRVLGIDPGTRFCGYGVVDLLPRQRPTYVECGVLQFSEKLPLPDRLYQLGCDLKEVIAELQPTDLAIESIFYHKNVQSAFRLGYARGVVLMVSAEYKLDLYEYSPNVVKKAVAGYGHAKKEEIQRMVSWQCGLSYSPQSDAADALAVALCHAFQVSAQLPVKRKTGQKEEG